MPTTTEQLDRALRAEAICWLRFVAMTGHQMRQVVPR